MLKKRYVRVMGICLLTFTVLNGCSFLDKESDKSYVELELPTEMFYYDLNYGDDFQKICEVVEQDDSDEELSEYYVLEGEVGQVILYDEFLYCEKEKKEAIEEYYNDDSNFEWFIEFEQEDDYIRFPIDVTNSEKEKIYAMDQAEKEETLFLNDVTKMATLMQVSKDNVVCGKINLVYFNDVWYWQTEIIDEDMMKDDYYAEYVHSLPETLIDKINTVK